MTEKKGKKRSSDRPSADELKKQRDAFLNTFFRKGAEFTEELVKENDRLRRQVLELEAKNAELRSALASDQAMRDLLKKIEHLEREKQALLSHVNEAEALSGRVSNRYREMEEELSNLANLYVASYQLHSTLRLDRAVKHLKELLQQLVGSRDYAFYFVNATASELQLIAKVGAAAPPARVTLRGEPTTGPSLYLERVFLTSEPRILSGPLERCSLDEPAAVVPMRVDDMTCGVIAVFTVLEHKQAFVPVDFELFKMLSAHAATALCGALLFFDSDGKLPGLQPFAHIEPNVGDPLRDPAHGDPAHGDPSAHGDPNVAHG